MRANRNGSNHKERLKDALVELCTSEELHRIARLAGPRVPTRKADLADHVVRYLADNGLRNAYESLGQLERAAVAEVVHSDSDALDMERFQAKYGQIADPSPPNPGTFVRQPSRLDFFLIGRDRLMPRDIKRRLKEFVTPPPPATMQTIDSPPTVHAGGGAPGGAKGVPVRIDVSEQRVQRELPAVLRLIDSRKILMGSKTLRPSKAAKDAVSAVLDGEDFYQNDRPARKFYDPNPGPIRAFAWPIILLAGGLARIVGNRLELTEDGRESLSSPPSEVIRRLWRRWIDASELDELSRIECVKGQTGKGRRSLTSAQDRRKAIQRALASCPTDVWIEFDELVRFSRASGIDTTVAHSPWGLYVGHREYGSLGYAGGAEVLHQAYLKAFLLEYAATMGILDVALIHPADAPEVHDGLWGADELPYFSRYDGLIAIRVNPFGAYCIGTNPQYAAPADNSQRILRVLPNGDVVANSGISAADRLALDQYFEPESDLTWRIENKKLLSLVEGGGTIAQVREYLFVHSEASLPETVARLLDDVEERCNSIREVDSARLIECDDEALATLIAHDTHTRRHCLLAGSRYLVIPKQSEAAFRHGLKKLGLAIRRDE